MFRTFICLISIIFQFLVETKSLQELKLSEKMYVLKSKNRIVNEIWTHILKLSLNIHGLCTIRKVLEVIIVWWWTTKIFIIKFKNMFILVIKIVKMYILWQSYWTFFRLQLSNIFDRAFKNLNNMSAWTRAEELLHQLTCQYGQEKSHGTLPIDKGLQIIKNHWDRKN